MKYKNILKDNYTLFYKILMSILLSFLMVFLNIKLRIYSSNIVDIIGKNEIMSNIIFRIMTIVVILIVISFIFKYLQKYICYKKCCCIYEKLFYNICHSKPEWLDSQERGESQTVWIKDVDNIDKFFERILCIAIPDIFYFILSFLFIFKINKILAIIIVIVSVIPVIIMYITSNILKPWYEKLQQCVSSSNGILDVATRNIELIKSYSSENYILEKYDEELKKVNETNKKLCKKEALLSMVSTFTGFMTIFVCVVYGGWLVGNNEISMGTLFSIILLTDYIIDPVMRFSNTFSMMKKAKVSSKRIGEFICCPRETSGENIYEEKESVISLRNVSFSYDNRLPVIRNFNLDINKGDRVCLIGNIGSGKSTILKLITGILKAKTGTVTVYGEDLINWDIEYYRNLISFVGQNNILFSGTIYDNITMTNSMVDVNDVERVCKLAGIHEDIIKMPNGYNTNVDEGAFRLSGGQKQRISIARALLKDSPIFIMDEPSAALDLLCKQILKETISKLSKEKTIIMITHDMDMIMDGFRVVNLNEKKENYQQ